MADETSKSLQDRVAIVTGSSRGIGRAVALHLASLGAKLVINYTSNAARANEVTSLINSSSSEPLAIAVKADISDPEGVPSLFDAALQAFHAPAQILVNCAGVVDPKYPSIASTALEDFDTIFAVNARGAFLCCKEGAVRLKRGGGGRLVLFSSSLVAASRPGYGAYMASKAAVESMVKVAAKELKGTGITANCVAPGSIATEMFFSGKGEEVRKVIEECPLGRLGQTQDVAPLVGFLVSDAGQWINGQTKLPTPPREHWESSFAPPSIQDHERSKFV